MTRSDKKSIVPPKPSSRCQPGILLARTTAAAGPNRLRSIEQPQDMLVPLLLRHSLRVFKETIEELGGLKGIGILAIGMFFFVLIVQNTISNRHSYSANYDRLRTAPVRKRK